MKSNDSKTRVSFRIFSPDLDPEDVSKNLGMVPDHIHHQGDHPQGNPMSTPYKHGMWLLKSRLPSDQLLEVHLNGLLSILEPKQTYLRTLAQRAIIDFYCVLFWQNGFQLSPQTLRRIADLEAALGVVVYPDDSQVPTLPEESSVI